MRDAGAMSFHLDTNARLVLNSLRTGGRSRAELAESTGWSRNTVASRLTELTDAGWVREDSEVQGDRGRPSLSYAVNPRGQGVYVAIFGWDQLHGAICGLDGEILAGEATRFGLGDPQAAIEATADQLARLRAQPAARDVPLAAAVIGTPSPVANPIQLAAWSPIGAVPTDFSDRLGLPVILENDANLMAVGLRREFAETGSFVFVKIATGIGAGIIVGGRLHTGIAGLAGEIGHIPVRSGGDRQCACGNRGCLAEQASVPSLLRQLSSGTRRVANLEALANLVTSGDGEAVAALRSAGRDIGEALVGVVTGIAPDVLVLGGRLTQLGDHLATGVRESLTRYTLPALSSRIRVTTTSKHRTAGLRGGAELAFDVLLAT